MAIITQTPRTHLREVTGGDAGFVNALLNEPSFLRYIGDRGVRTAEDAARFIDEVYRRSYREHGFGLYVVQSSLTRQPMGLCGFVRRDVLPAADLGFAFLPEYERQGFAHEAATAVLEVGRSRFGLAEVLAIVQEENVRSRRLLERLGFRHTGTRTMPGDTTPVWVFSTHPAQPPAALGAQQTPPMP